MQRPRKSEGGARIYPLRADVRAATSLLAPCVTYTLSDVPSHAPTHMRELRRSARQTRYRPTPLPSARRRRACRASTGSQRLVEPEIPAPVCATPVHADTAP